MTLRALNCFLRQSQWFTLCQVQEYPQSVSCRRIFATQYYPFLPGIIKTVACLLRKSAVLSDRAIYWQG